MRGLQPLFIRGLLRALYFCVVFFSILFTTIYCFYFGTYRSEFDDVSFLSVVATTRTEAAEYMRTTFTAPELAVMGLLVLLFIGLALTMTAAVHAGSRMKSLPPPACLPVRFPVQLQTVVFSSRCVQTCP